LNGRKATFVIICKGQSRCWVRRDPTGFFLFFKLFPAKAEFLWVLLTKEWKHRFGKLFLSTSPRLGSYVPSSFPTATSASCICWVLTLKVKSWAEGQELMVLG
jgi:hypothetical protein